MWIPRYKCRSCIGTRWTRPRVGWWGGRGVSRVKKSELWGILIPRRPRLLIPVMRRCVHLCNTFNLCALCNTFSLYELCGLHNSPFRHSFLSNLSSHESLAGKLWRSISQFLERKRSSTSSTFLLNTIKKCKRFLPNFLHLWNTEMRNIIQFALFCNSYILKNYTHNEHLT